MTYTVLPHINSAMKFDNISEMHETLELELIYNSSQCFFTICVVSETECNFYTP